MATFIPLKNACSKEYQTQSKYINKLETKQKKRPTRRNTDQVWWPFQIYHGVSYTPFVSRWLTGSCRKRVIKALANEDTSLRTQILFRNIISPQQTFPSLRSPRNIMGNNVSATMCPPYTSEYVDSPPGRNKVAVRPGGGVLPQILDRGVPRRFWNPNPI